MTEKENVTAVIPRKKGGSINSDIGPTMVEPSVPSQVNLAQAEWEDVVVEETTCFCFKTKKTIRRKKDNFSLVTQPERNSLNEKLLPN